MLVRRMAIRPGHLPPPPRLWRDPGARTALRLAAQSSGAIGCACDFLTPIGHQCNTLAMGPRGCRFGNYWCLGLPLPAIVAAVATALIPRSGR